MNGGVQSRCSVGANTALRTQVRVGLFPQAHLLVLLVLAAVNLKVAIGADAQAAINQSGRQPGTDGTLLGNPVLGRNADGYLEVFQVDNEGVLRHRWQKKSNGDWSAWSTLGANFLPGIAVANNTAGELEVFAVTAGKPMLMHARQDRTNSTDWTTWSNFGENIRPPLAAGHNADGRVEVFAREARGLGILHRWQTKSGWSDWESLGGAVEPGVVVARNRDGRLELFGINADTKPLVHCWQQEPNGSSSWTKWESLGGAILPGFAVGQNTRGILEVFGVNRTNGAVERICQASPANSENWTAWQDFAGSLEDGLAVGQSADGRLEVMGINRSDQMLAHRWEILNDGSDKWSAWASLGKQARPFPAVGQNEDGNLEVFAVDLHNGATMNHKRQISRASDWLDWATMDHATFQYSSRTWQTDEGLPHNQVLAITQTPEGYLWVGTQGGLARFDGMSFTTFDSRNTPEMRNSAITALCADREGTLWIGTEGGGLVGLRDGVFTHYGKSDGLAGDVLKVIYQSRDGALWIGTTTGMSRYSDGKFMNYTRRQGLSSEAVSYIHEDRDGYLWIATGEGLNRFKDEKMDTFAMPNGLPNDSVRVIWQDRAGRIWIGSNNGMLWYNSYWKSFYAYNTKYGLSDTFVSAICDDQEGNLWVGTYSGLNRFREGRFFNELNNEGVPFDRVNALFEDQEGDLWVGSREGLSRLTPKRFFAYTKRQGLSHNNVMSVMEDKGGSLWLGTWGGGLNRLQNERVTIYATTNDLSQTLVLSLGERQDGSLWIGADFDGGLTRLKDGVFTHYTWKDNLPNAAVHVIYEDRATNLWLGTGAGLSTFQGGKFTNYTIKDGLGGNVVWAISENPQGVLWFGTDGGLTRLQDGRFVNISTNAGLPDNSVLTLCAEPDGTLWVGTHQGGLTRYRNKQFTTYTSRQGLFSDEILDILDDQQGWLWMTCARGVFRVRKKDLAALDEGLSEGFSSIVYGKNDGLESTQCNGDGKPGAWRARDGRLWFPTTKGVASIDPKTAPINPLPPPVFIEQVIADRRSVSDLRPQPRGRQALGSSTSAGIADPKSEGTALTIPPGRGELEFHYTAVALAAPESTRFQYKLDNVDSEWVEAGTRRVAHYNNIYPGSYRFRVRACNADGIWNKTGAMLSIEVSAHVWQTWWWRASVILLLIGSAGGTARYITHKRLERKLRLLEQRHAIEKERGRIAKDIHDDLGSSLTRIMMLGERAEEGLTRHEEVGAHVNKIIASARASVQAMDEIVWAVNPENDTLEGLVEYLSHYADEFFEDSDVRCRLELPVRLPARTLSAEIRHDLFLVVKEAFNNVAKHAHATEVRVQVSAAGSRLGIQLEDNGRGFVPAAAHNGRHGNGLGNMAKRLAAHGGNLEIISAPGKGTQIRISALLPDNEDTISAR